MWIHYQLMIVCPLNLNFVAQIFSKMACFCKCFGPPKLFTPTLQFFYTDISVISGTFCSSEQTFRFQMDASQKSWAGEHHLCVIVCVYFCPWLPKTVQQTECVSNTVKTHFDRIISKAHVQYIYLNNLTQNIF